MSEDNNMKKEKPVVKEQPEVKEKPVKEVKPEKKEIMPAVSVFLKKENQILH